MVAEVGAAVDDVSGFPFALLAPSEDALLSGEVAAWASVVGVVVGPGGDVSGDALVWASMVGGFGVGHAVCLWSLTGSPLGVGWCGVADRWVNA